MQLWPFSFVLLEINGYGCAVHGGRASKSQQIVHDSMALVVRPARILFASSYVVSHVELLDSGVRPAHAPESVKHLPRCGAPDPCRYCHDRLTAESFAGVYEPAHG